MSNPEKKRKKLPVSPLSTPTLNPSLPDDLLLSCFARISRLYYPVLSLVSKSFRFLIASPALHHTRSLLGHPESSLYVCLRFPPDLNPRWFTLCRTPERLKKNSSGNLLVSIPIPIPIPSTDYPPPQSSSLIAFGSDIYKIGGDSRVHVLDCHSQTWKQVQSMKMERNSSSTACVLNGKIYVAGGCQDPNSDNWIEVFDPKTQTWSSIPSPDVKIRNGRVVKSLGIKGKLYLYGINSSGIYDPIEGRWETTDFYYSMMGNATFYCHCVIDDVVFFGHRGAFTWYDTKVRLWQVLNGVEYLPDFSKMTAYGGKIAVLWDECDDNGEKNIIWCAVIAVERRNNGEMWGKLEWSNVVLTVPKSCHLLNADALSATLP